jgi:hypothetical protein
MKHTKKFVLLIAMVLFTAAHAFSQEENTIDASKPTNFYTQLDNTFENTNSSGQNVFGYRGKLMFAPSESHLILGEVPLLYNDRTEKFGIGDISARYFFLPYKNYDKLLGAFGPSVDVFVPTGSFEDGLGNGRIVVSPGVTAGLMVADWIQFFPILSYQYVGKPLYDNPTSETSQETHGISIQVVTPVVISDRFFIQVTPIYKINDLKNKRQDRYQQELFAAYSLTDKMQLNGFYNGNFKDNVHQVSVGLTLFL